MDLIYEKSGCQVLYEDRDILVCFKRAGLAVQSARLGELDMTSILKTWLREKEPSFGEPYLGIVHRLDQPVRGLVLLARNKKAAGALSAQLNDGRMEKYYLARVRMTGQIQERITRPEQGQAQEQVTGQAPGRSQGQVSEHAMGQTKEQACGWFPDQELVDYLIKEAGSNLSRVVREGTPGAKKAELSYRILQMCKGQEKPEALLEIRLGTGRHHQIRVQLAHAGMPIIGDRKYAADPDTDRTRFPMLCAWKLCFDHPRTGKRMCISAEPQEIGFAEPQEIGFAELQET